MNRKLCSAAALLGISAAALALVPLFTALHSRAKEEAAECPAGFTVISQEEWDEITGTREETAMDPSAVLFDGARISYVDADYTADGCTYYVPQDPDSSVWDGCFTADGGARLLILEDDLLSDKAAAVQEGRVFPCLYVDGETYSRFCLIMTGVPTVSIEYDSSSPLTEEGEDHDGLIYVREADGTYSTSACTIHIRGGVSRNFDKKSYKLSLKTEDGDNNSLSLCGMRSDDDWILNSLYKDATRTHEVLAYEVWEQMLTISGSEPQTARMEYVEVFLNNEYIGLYALMEPVDGKTFQLDDSDVLYKITNHTYADAVESLWPDGITRFNGEEEIEGAKIAWPKADSLLCWDTLETVYQFTQGRLTLSELENEGVRLDTDAAAYYELLVVLTCAEDNTWKNSYLVCEAQADGTYAVSPSPWDLNGTWGSDFTTAYNADSAQDPDHVHSLLWESWQRDDADGAWEAVCNAWETLRSGGLSAESVTAQATELWTDLLRSGAAVREANRWPGSVDGNNYYEMNEWIEARFETLDAYYGYEE